MKFTLSRFQLIVSCLGVVFFFVFLSRAKHVFVGKRTTGEVIGEHIWGSRTKYTDPVVSFEDGFGTVTFYGESNLHYQRGDRVPVIYLEREDPEAYINTFLGFWLRPLMYSIIPVFLLLAALLSFFSAKDTFLFSFTRPFGMKILRDKGEVLEELKEEADVEEIRRKAFLRMKSGKRKR
jgi:hypothetical protein